MFDPVPTLYAVHSKFRVHYYQTWPIRKSGSLSKHTRTHIRLRHWASNRRWYPDVVGQGAGLSGTQVLCDCWLAPGTREPGVCCWQPGAWFIFPGPRVLPRACLQVSEIITRWQEGGRLSRIMPAMRSLGGIVLPKAIGMFTVNLKPSLLSIYWTLSPI